MYTWPCSTGYPPPSIHSITAEVGFHEKDFKKLSDYQMFFAVDTTQTQKFSFYYGQFLSFNKNKNTK